MEKTKYIIANWKMKLGIAESAALAAQYAAAFTAPLPGVTAVACPSFISLTGVRDTLRGAAVQLGAQDVVWEEKGSYTGEVAPSMLEEAGCGFVIIGHSERRQHVGEHFQMIHQKVKAVLATDTLTPVVCVGETLQERDSDRRDYVIVDQLQQAFGGIHLLSGQRVIVAYEPVWAIGSGQALKPEDADTMHEIIRAALVEIFGFDVASTQVSTIYGGSITPQNTTDFAALDNVDGLLIGGASLNADDFKAIATSFSSSLT